jgi:hypothetical protein
MKRYLSGLSSPMVVVCFQADDQGVAQAVDYEQLKKEAGGSDPFSLPNDIDPSKNTDFQNLLKARFMGGFRAKIGLPDSIDPLDLQDIVSFDSGSINKVGFRMYCSEFQVVQLEPGGGYVSRPTWFAASQDPFSPWIFESNVDLSQSVIEPDSYHKLPGPVNQKIEEHKKSGMTFSVQQLWINLSTANLYATPTIKGVERDSVLGMNLERGFLTRYFDMLRSNKQPLLGVNIVDDRGEMATLSLTDFQLQVNPYLDSNGRPMQDPTFTQARASTLSYLCATESNVLPPRKFSRFSHCVSGTSWLSGRLTIGNNRIQLELARS